MNKNVSLSGAKSVIINKEGAMSEAKSDFLKHNNERSELVVKIIIS